MPQAGSKNWILELLTIISRNKNMAPGIIAPAEC